MFKEYDNCWLSHPPRHTTLLALAYTRHLMDPLIFAYTRYLPYIGQLLEPHTIHYTPHLMDPLTFAYTRFLMDPPLHRTIVGPSHHPLHTFDGPSHPPLRYLIKHSKYHSITMDTLSTLLWFKYYNWKLKTLKLILLKYTIFSLDRYT